MSQRLKMVNLEELEWSRSEGPGAFEREEKKLTKRSWDGKLGVRKYRIPPGKKAWPRHAHLANEEAILIQQGRATLRYGEVERSVSEGDFFVFPAGPEHAHQLVNSGDEPLVYLCVSTMEDPDVTLYPDSRKLGIFYGSPPGGEREQRVYHRYLDEDAQLDYWDREN